MTLRCEGAVQSVAMSSETVPSGHPKRNPCVGVTTWVCRPVHLMPARTEAKVQRTGGTRRWVCRCGRWSWSGC